MFALMEGEIMTECDAFVDSLMAEECLKESRQPLIVELITIAINEGENKVNPVPTFFV
jgi:hypothetical protein